MATTAPVKDPVPVVASESKASTEAGAQPSYTYICTHEIMRYFLYNTISLWYIYTNIFEMF